MSVFTNVSEQQARTWLKQYTIGALIKLEGIASGVENTNYFLTTTHGEFVLTLFEKLTASELPYYLDLMAHLARHGIPSPLPIADIQGSFLGELNGKPACIVTRLSGRPVEQPDEEHCAEVGELLAEMHLAAKSFPLHMNNWRGPSWWKTFVPEVRPHLTGDEAALLQSELEFQLRQEHEALPRGVIHGDLFRDNVLFFENRAAGVIDFYFACDEVLLFDIAITVNDWCMGSNDTLEESRVRALLRAYDSVRPLTSEEHRAWPAQLRAAAYRTWLGRLGYVHFPQPGEMTHTKDHALIRRILQRHIQNGDRLKSLWI
jgi:homoserine kinase type II